MDFIRQIGPTAVLPAVFVLLLSGCAMNVAGEMLTATVQQEDAIEFNEFVEVMPGPGFVISTSRQSTLTVLLVAECRVAIEGQVLEARIIIDDEPAQPVASILTTTARFEARSLLASMHSVGPGTHRIAVQWRTTRGSASIRRRSLTVWQLSQ